MGAVVPLDYANQAATNAHLATKYAAAVHVPYYHGAHYLGKREADAEADAGLVGYPHGAHYGYGYLHGKKKREAEPFGYFAGAVAPYGYAYHQPLVAHPNGAVVPLEPAAVVNARAEHLATKFGY